MESPQFTDLFSCYCWHNSYWFQTLHRHCLHRHYKYAYIKPQQTNFV